MAVNLIPSSFITDDDTKLAVVDVYAETKEAVSNSVFKQVDAGLNAATEVTNEVKQELLKSVTGVKSVLTAKHPGYIIADIASGKLTKDTLLAQMGVLDKAAAIAKLKAAINPNLVNDIKGNVLTGILKGVGFKGDSDALVKGILGLPGGKTPVNVLLDANPKLKLIYGEAEHLRDLKDVKSATDVFNLMNQLSFSPEIIKALDMESQMATLDTVLDFCVKFNIPEGIDKTVNYFEKRSEKRKYALKNAQKAAEGGNLQLINRILELAGADALMSNTPLAINKILMGYRLPAGMKTITQQEAELLRDTLASLNPNWHQYQRNGIWISNLEPFQVMGADAVKAFKLLNMFTVEIGIAKTYPKTSLVALSKKRYPRAAI